ncbi:hypothetical protein HN873_024334 [Arachis hypogaea]
MKTVSLFAQCLWLSAIVIYLIGEYERLGEADCIYYLRTGFYGYGSHCRFNHPRDQAELKFIVHLIFKLVEVI